MTPSPRRGLRRLPNLNTISDGWLLFLLLGCYIFGVISGIASAILAY